MIEFVPFHEVALEIAPNVSRHYEEMNRGDNLGTPDIDWNTYLNASHAGICYAVIARDEDKLVGYSVFVIGYNLRYKTVLEADSHGFFIEKDYRGKLGLEMLKFAQEKLLEKGVKVINYTTNDEEFGKLLMRNKYKTEYKIWSYHG